MTVVQFQLTWTDDDTTEGGVYENQPDRFRLTVQTPAGEEFSEEAEDDSGSNNGIIIIEVPGKAALLFR